MHDVHLPQHIMITYSTTGQPTITALNPEGVAFGQGYLSALHRFWTMEQQRRIASARMSEIAGSATLEIDKWICRLGIIEAVEACYKRTQEDKEYYNVLQSYTAGINYALQHQRKKCLGFEFQLMKCEAEPWTPKDTVRILILISWSLAGNWEEQLVRIQTLAQLGPKQAALLEVDSWLNNNHPGQNYQQLASHVFSAFASLSETANLLSSYQEIRRRAGLLPRRSGSNAWIVGGEHTDSGKPILAGDPHMPLGLPGLFYEVRLQTQDKAINAIGAAIPGIPGIIVGRNTSLAWTITISGAITAELRLEQVSESEPAQQSVYTIKVKGQEDVQEVVSQGSRGPLLQQHTSVPLEITEQFNLSLEWAGHSGTDAGTLHGLWYMMQAQDSNQLHTAVSQWGGPVLNLLWAEVEKTKGAYGWRIIGSIPCREDAQEGLLPALADLAARQWAKGYIPTSQLPAEVNPERGYLVSANNRMAPADYPFLISHEYMSSYRAERIAKLIQACISTKKYTVEDARLIQIDQTSEAALTLRNIIVQAVSERDKLVVHHEALNLLKRWDGALKVNSAAAAIFKVTEDHLYSLMAEQLFLEQPTQQSAWLGNGYTPINAGLMAHWRLRELFLALVISRPIELEVFPAHRWPILLQKAFSQAVDELSKHYGKTPGLWRWGQLHKLELKHPLIQVPIYQELPPVMLILKGIFRLSRGPYEIGGDEHTPWQSSSYPVPVEYKNHKKRLWATAYQPAYRFIASHNLNIQSCLPGGICGHPWRSWSSNQLTNYLHGRLFQSSLFRSNET